MGKKKNSQVEQAAMVHAMLNGDSIDDAVAEAAMVQQLLSGGISATQSSADEDDFELDIEFEEEKPKKKSKKNSTIEKVGSENQQFTTQVQYIPECNFASFVQPTKIRVRYKEHELLYKEQHYPIPSREVVYNIELIKLPKEAVNAVEYSYSNPTEQQIYEAKSGATRWLKIVCYDNNIPSRSRCLGYVEVQPNYKVAIKIKKAILNEQHINGDRLHKDIKDKLKNMIKYN